jgi:hypothetical protein
VEMITHLAFHTGWPESKSLSPLSWRVIARNSGHMVPLDRPDVIVAEITLLIDYLRGGPAPPFGSTAPK